MFQVVSVSFFIGEHDFAVFGNSGDEFNSSKTDHNDFRISVKRAKGDLVPFRISGGYRGIGGSRVDKRLKWGIPNPMLWPAQVKPDVRALF